MCTVSAIHDYGRNVQTAWTIEGLQEFHKLLEAAKKFDQVTGQPDCEDTEKTKWLEIAKREVENANG